MKKILFLLIIGLCFLLYKELLWHPSSDLDESDVSDVIDELEALDNLPDSQSILNFSEIIERPLFASDRSAPKKSSSIKQSSQDSRELKNLRLFGIVKSSTNHYAFVFDSKSKQVLRLYKGDHYKNWLVEQLMPNAIRFSSEEAEYELSLSQVEDKNIVKDNLVKGVSKQKTQIDELQDDSFYTDSTVGEEELEVLKKFGFDVDDSINENE